MIGKSVHSQRVEWLKHNVVYAITALYYKNVQYLEEIMKRWVNEVHIGALQYTFVPRANRALDFLQIAETPIHFQWEKPIFKTVLDLVDEYPKGTIMHLRSEFYSYSPGEMFLRCLGF